MKLAISPALLIPVLCCLLGAVGCGNQSGQHRLTGTVTLDGQAVESGEIVFRPADGTGAAEGGQITEGKYEVLVSAGAKTIVITATREEGTARDGLPNYIQYIPSKYNTKTELSETVDTGSDKVLNFDLQS